MDEAQERLQSFSKLNECYPRRGAPPGFDLTLMRFDRPLPHSLVPKRLRNPVWIIAHIMQTFPVSAFGFLLPLPFSGSSARARIVALVVYSLRHHSTPSPECSRRSECA